MSTVETDATVKGADVISSFLDRVSAQQEEAWKAFGTFTERATRVNEEFTNSLVAGQKDAIALTKKIVSKPTDLTGNTEAFLDSLTANQERSMKLAKVVYTEQNQAADKFREVVEPLFERQFDFNESARKMNEMIKKVVPTAAS